MTRRELMWALVAFSMNAAGSSKLAAALTHHTPADHDDIRSAQ